MNETDLRTVLAERSAGKTSDPAVDRLAGVHRRVLRRRRLRRGTAVAGAALALLALGGVATARTDPSPAPAGPPAGTVDGFPEYAEGARVVATARGALPERSTRLTVTPTTLDLVIFTSCPEPASLPVELEIQVDGHPFFSGTCGGSWSTTVDGWRDVGARVGRPAVLTVRAGAADDGAGGRLPVPPRGEFGVAVGERVPVGDYPFPPRPAPLPPLERPVGDDGEPLPPDALVLRSDPADPTASRRATITWGPAVRAWMSAQTPGRLRVRVAGVEVADASWWDYRAGQQASTKSATWAGEHGLRLLPGQRVAVEVIPERFTGDWLVAFVPTVD
ncbi:hypothetical protein [Micromonospora siamensis]|uniref:Uncharacterized protein n=1 Tax=Micromonospora siamensis TaxID=299152 RepID=A0A1C5HUP7_9ACTN|nr:hypothetical protein [Micromonospora siamensis]SCG49351.1 hypothetical protein GA0074704_2333 [Micromonospora siamensis]